ncbi:hypothetical protein HDU92_001633 [Lobulomyces angularis]|nr:hypothetical protein HDU92_001633 [Lobulomyces angularis]
MSSLSLKHAPESLKFSQLTAIPQQTKTHLYCSLPKNRYINIDAKVLLFRLPFITKEFQLRPKDSVNEAANLQTESTCEENLSDCVDSKPLNFLEDSDKTKHQTLRKYSNRHTVLKTLKNNIIKSGDRICDECGKKFNRTAELRRHIGCL